MGFAVGRNHSYKDYSANYHTRHRHTKEAKVQQAQSNVSEAENSSVLKSSDTNLNVLDFLQASSYTDLLKYELLSELSGLTEADEELDDAVIPAVPEAEEVEEAEPELQASEEKIKMPTPYEQLLQFDMDAFKNIFVFNDLSDYDPYAMNPFGSTGKTIFDPIDLSLSYTPVSWSSVEIAKWSSYGELYQLEV